MESAGSLQHRTLVVNLKLLDRQLRVAHIFTLLAGFMVQALEECFISSLLCIETRRRRVLVWSKDPT